MLESGTEFRLVRLYWIVGYYAQSTFAFFLVVALFALVAIKWLEHNKFVAPDALIIANAIQGFYLAINGLLWIPAHFMQGLGMSQEAAAWGRSISPYLLPLVGVSIAGICVYIYAFWNRYTAPFIVIGALIAVLIFLVGWKFIGGFGFTYVR